MNKIIINYNNKTLWNFEYFGLDTCVLPTADKTCMPGSDMKFLISVVR